MDDRINQALGASFAAMLLSDALLRLSVENGALSKEAADALVNRLILQCENMLSSVEHECIWDYAWEQLLRVLANSHGETRHERKPPGPARG